MTNKKRYNSSGVYHYSITELSVLQTAHTSLQGFFWLANLADAVKRIRVRAIEMQFTIDGATAMPTHPRVTFQRITHTGTSHSGGTAFLPIEADSRQPAAVGSLRTASTGLANLATVSSNAPFAQFYAPVLTQATAAGLILPTGAPNLWKPFDEHEEILLLPGEGIVCQQPDNGTASDGRRFITRLVTEEFRV